MRQRAGWRRADPGARPAADGLRTGERVWFRHAKAGALGERVNALHLIEGNAIAAAVPACPDEGKAFP